MINKKAVIFDFDETLVLQNSLKQMFRIIGGNLYWLPIVLLVIRSIALGKFGYKLRKKIKNTLYKKYIKDTSKEIIYQTGLKAASSLTVNENVMSKLEAANLREDIVIVATASPRVYVSAILDALDIKRCLVIGTEIDFLTGKIIGKECSRDAKWTAIVKETAGMKIKSITAYGNIPDDLFMLKKANNGFVIKGSKIIKQ